MTASEQVEVRGHLMDTGMLARVLDDVLDYGADYVVRSLELGRAHDDESRAIIEIGAQSQEQLERVLMRVQRHGVNPTTVSDARVQECLQDGVFPDDFYSTTNLDTEVRLNGRWVPVSRPEMDCGIVIDLTGGARTLPVSDVRSGQAVVCGAVGVRVQSPADPDGERQWGFMASAVSSEKPQALQVRLIAEQMRSVRAAGQRILWVGGPAVIHTGAAPAMVALVEQGWVDVLFAGNALATHDIEASLFGTSLGVDLSAGRGVEHGHEHHIRAINTVRRCGSIAAAVEQGVLTSGVMHAMVRAGKEFVLVGSVRDDGPLPDVITDVIEGQRAMRERLDGVGYVIMVATMLHSIATGNLMPASVPLVCVDINPATVTKLADRGSSQAVGVVTDIGLFLEQLTRELVPGWR